jgi:hypothetical protein
MCEAKQQYRMSVVRWLERSWGSGVTSSWVPDIRKFEGKAITVVHVAAGMELYNIRTILPDL